MYKFIHSYVSFKHKKNSWIVPNNHLSLYRILYLTMEENVNHLIDSVYNGISLDLRITLECIHHVTLRNAQINPG